MSLRYAILLPLAAAACAGLQPAPEPPSTVRVAIAPPADAGVPADTCVIAQDNWTSSAPRVLRAPSGAVFADVLEANRLVITARPAARLEVDVHGVHLSTVPQEGDVPVYVRTPRLFGGVLRAGSGTALRWRASDGRMHVALPTDPRVRFEPGVATSADIPCEELTSVASPAQGSFSDHLVHGSRLAIAAAPGGPVAARLFLPEGTQVTVEERRGPHVLIAWYLEAGPLEDATVVGWVDAAVVTEGLAGGAEGRTMRTGAQAGSADWRGCSKEQPLFVSAGHGTEQVGTLAVGTQLHPLSKNGTMVVVELRGPSRQVVPSPLRLRNAARFVVPEYVAKDCGDK